MSESVERRLLEKLGNPTVSPYGNPIPGLDELGAHSEATAPGSLRPLTDVASTEVQRVIVRRIAEPVQDDGEVMSLLRRIGAMPGAFVKVHLSPGGVSVGSAGEYSELAFDVAQHLLVETA